MVVFLEHLSGSLYQSCFFSAVTNDTISGKRLRMRLRVSFLFEGREGLMSDMTQRL